MQCGTIMFNTLTLAFHVSFLLLINYFDNVLTRFIVNNRTDAFKTDVNLFFTHTHTQQFSWTILSKGERCNEVIPM